MAVGEDKQQKVLLFHSVSTQSVKLSITYTTKTQAPTSAEPKKTPSIMSTSVSLVGYVVSLPYHHYMVSLPYHHYMVSLPCHHYVVSIPYHHYTFPDYHTVSFPYHHYTQTTTI